MSSRETDGGSQNILKKHPFYQTLKKKNPLSQAVFQILNWDYHNW